MTRPHSAEVTTVEELHSIGDLVVPIVLQHWRDNLPRGRTVGDYRLYRMIQAMNDYLLAASRRNSVCGMYENMPREHKNIVLAYAIGKILWTCVAYSSLIGAPLEKESRFKVCYEMAEAEGYVH